MIRVAFRLLCLCLIFFSLEVYAQEQTQTELLPACKKKNKCGYINRKGKIVIEMKFASTHNFSEGLAGASLIIDGVEKFGFIDKTGKMIIQPQFYWVWEFSDGLARFQENEKEYRWGFIDRTGKIVVAPTLVAAESFSEGLANIGVRKPANSAGQEIFRECFINTKGEIVIPCDFETASPFSEGLAIACIGKQYGFIDKTGKWAFKPEFIRDKLFATLESFSDGLAAFAGVHWDGTRRWGYIDKTGKVVIEPKYTQAKPFSEGLAAVQFTTDGGNFGYIDKTGKVILPFEFSNAGNFSEGLADVYVGNGSEYDARYAYIDRTGKRISRKTYSAAFAFKNGLAQVSKMNIFARLDSGSFGGLAGGSTYYIDKSEKVIWKGKD